jgi:hypothetical protein
MNDPIIIKEIQKNTNNKIKISVQEYKGKWFLDLRNYLLTENGEIPTKKGIALHSESIADVIEGLLKGAEELKKIENSNGEQ